MACRIFQVSADFPQNEAFFEAIPLRFFDEVATDSDS